MAAVRILLVSYWYPPAVGAAAERIGSFARYLPEHGWDVTVLTAARKPALPEQAGVEVLAVPDRLAGAGPAFADYEPRRRRASWRAALREWLLFPDRFALWARAAAKTGVELLRRERFDLILASFPPASSALVGLRLHEVTGIPLVVDFRDLWLGPGGYEPRSRRSLAAHRKLERAVVSAATALVAVSESMAIALATAHGFNIGRIFPIPNGYEPATISSTETDEAAKRQPETGKEQRTPNGPPAAKPPADTAILHSQFPILHSVTISHVGTVIARNRPDLFFESLRRLRDDPRLADVEFRFVGNLSRDYAASLGPEGRVTTTGLVSRQDARREMQTADALLLLTGSYVGRWGYNAKLFEYIQTGRPILCLEETPHTNDRGLLERFAAERSFIAPIHDPAAIADAVERLRHSLAAQHEPAAARLDTDSQEFSRANLAARLSDCLRRVAK